jgi:succinate dehydrogenase / fumarate reductase cytochrome b subunit
VEKPVVEEAELSFWERHSFAIRRLHSLSGLIPVGAYMVIHLAVNASVINGAETFQANVYGIHKFGALLPWLEWTFIFIPILFHAVVGMVIVAGGLPNTHQYPYEANYRYTLQRATGVIAFFFIGLHVFHMHGWFHQHSWVTYVVEPWGGAQFRPYNATSTAGLAFNRPWGVFPAIAVVILYAVGVLSCVYHLANGIWTMGITWGVWTSPRAQRRALQACAAVGVILAVVSMLALVGMRRAVDDPDELEAVRQKEAQMLKYKIESGELQPDKHKMSEPAEDEEAQANSAHE